MLHDAINRFREERGTETEIPEANMAHQLAGLAHEPLFQVFLSVHKDYDSLDREWCL